MVQEYCEKKDIEIQVSDPNQIQEPLFPTNEPFINGKILRDGKWSYQYDLILKAVEYQRGIIKAATGSGKTSMMLGLISCYANSRVLFLCNTHVPITQFQNALKTSGLKNQIDISTIQSFYRKKPKEYIDKYDIIIVDEAHEGLRSSKSMYGNVLRNCLAPIRLGFTATLPDNESDRLNMIGLLGPVIGELTKQDGGLLFPIAGILVGALVGGGIGALANQGVDKKFVKEVEAALAPNSSALFLIVRAADPGPAISVLSQFKGKIYHTSLSDEDEKTLRKAMEGKF